MKITSLHVAGDPELDKMVVNEGTRATVMAVDMTVDEFAEHYLDNLPPSLRSYGCRRLIGKALDELQSLDWDLVHYLTALSQALELAEMEPEGEG